MKDPGSKDGFGLLASGSSRLWDVAIDESLTEANEWLAELEGPDTSLTFRLKDLNVVPEVIAFLSQRPGPQEVTLGRFARGSKVSLLRDNEDFVRCFILVEAGDGSSFRIALAEDDIRMLREAFERVRCDLGEAGAE